MNISPKLKIASGAAIVVGGAYMFREMTKSTEKKKKLMYGLAGGALVVSGFLVGKMGVVQVIGLRNQSKATDDSNNPAKAITADMAKEKVEVKKPTINNSSKSEQDGNIRTSTLAFDSVENKKSDSSFDTIMKSTASAESKNISVQPRPKQNVIPKNDTISANKNSAVTGMGAKVVGRVDSNVLEANRRRREVLQGQILEKENQHKKLIKASGWHSGLPLRNEISMLKAQLHYV